ncbi:N-alpha-acetyltransferase 60 [Aphelenchoides besseyi]|nr:N-alpha-acetyltransferase 60 [Aphelenchoides besseyi]KAI6231645.1 N-alpha-acetyltransferase 60 [Aphelenchoides besseyi]
MLEINSGALVTVRQLTTSDVGILQLLSDSILPGHYPPSTRYFYTILKHQETFFTAGVFLNNHFLVGFFIVSPDYFGPKNMFLCATQFEDQLSCSYGNKIAYISTFGVAKNFQRHQFGSLLMVQLLNHLIINSEANAVYLHVRTSNNPAIAFYRRHNFTIRHFVRGYYHNFQSNETPDAYIMVRELFR